MFVLVADLGGFFIGRAKQLLNQAGFPNGIDIDLWHSDNESFSRVAQSIQSFLAEADIRARLVQPREQAGAQDIGGSRWRDIQFRGQNWCRH